jgi:hypothetical protein
VTSGREAPASPGASPPSEAPARPALDGRDLAIALALAVAGAALLHTALEIWFTHDDFFQVRFVGRHGLWELVASPATRAQLPAGTLAPLLFVSLALDRRWFDLDAAAYQAHQLAAYALVVAALYLLARLWHPRPESAGVALLAALGPAMTGLVPLLMVRHYVEGSLAALVATGLYVQAARTSAARRARWLSLASTAAYAVAALAKEVFVPLPALLAVLPEADGRTRLRRLVPHGVVLVLYAFYRRWLLGTWGGGYGWEVDAASAPGLVARLPARLLDAAATPGGAAGTALVSVTVLATLALPFVRRRAALAVATATLALLGPLVPVAVEVAARWAAVPWIALSFAAAALLGSMPRRARLLGWTALASLAVATHAVAWPRIMAQARRISVENRAFLRLGPDDLLRFPASPPAALDELARFKQEDLAHLALGPPPKWFADDIFLCGGRHPGLPIWQFDPLRGEVVERTRSARLEARAHCRSIRRRAPLSARFVWRGRSLRWQLGPRHDGAYSVVRDEGVARIKVPRQGGFRLGGAPLRLRIRYDAPEGWVTYSDELDVRPESTLAWSRDAPSLPGTLTSPETDGRAARRGRPGTAGSDPRPPDPR